MQPISGDKVRIRTTTTNQTNATFTKINLDHIGTVRVFFLPLISPMRRNLPDEKNEIVSDHTIICAGTSRSLSPHFFPCDMCHIAPPELGLWLYRIPLEGKVSILPSTNVSIFYGKKCQLIHARHSRLRQHVSGAYKVCTHNTHIHT